MTVFWVGSSATRQQRQMQWQKQITYGIDNKKTDATTNDKGV
jgi:hypothetical protein